MSQYEKIIAPAEQKIAGKLKNYISEIQDSPQQVKYWNILLLVLPISWFGRYLCIYRVDQLRMNMDFFILR